VTNTSDRSFSFAWLFVAYFMIAGGIFVALIGAIALELDIKVGSYAAFGAGGLIGGLLSARATPHRSHFEAAAAGAMIAGSIALFLSYTAIGRLLYYFAQDAVIRETAILGAIGLAGGLAGATLGELSSSGPRSTSSLRWIGLGAVLTAGALFLCLIVVNAIMVDRALGEPALVGKVLFGSPIFEEEAFVNAQLIAMVIAPLVGGMVAQMAAPRRLFLPAGLGAGGAYLVVLLAILLGGNELEADSLLGSIVIAIVAGLLGTTGALKGWLFVRNKVKALTSEEAA
jgi:hypothetical protein